MLMHGPRRGVLFAVGACLAAWMSGAPLLGSGFSATEPVTSSVAAVLSPLPAGVVQLLGLAGFWTHLLIVLTFLNFLPIGKHFHVITGLPNVFFKRLHPSAKLSTPNLDAEEFGAKVV